MAMAMQTLCLRLAAKETASSAAAAAAAAQLLNPKKDIPAHRTRSDRNCLPEMGEWFGFGWCFYYVIFSRSMEAKEMAHIVRVCVAAIHRPANGASENR